MAPTPKQCDKKIKIVLTGFEPFGSHVTNPSWLAVEPLHNTTLDLPPSKDGIKGPKIAKITAHQLPVEYRKVPVMVPGLHATQSTHRHPKNEHGHKHGHGHEHGHHHPHKEQHHDTKENGLTEESDQGEEEYTKTYYIHLGVGRDGYCAIETLANRTGYSSPDNSKWSPPELSQPPVAGWESDPDRLHTVVDTAALAQYLREEKGWKCEKSEDAGHYLCEYTFYLSLAERERLIASGKESGKERVCLFVHVPSVGNPYTLEELQTFVKDMVLRVVTTH